LLLLVVKDAIPFIKRFGYARDKQRDSRTIAIGMIHKKRVKMKKSIEN